MHTNRLIGYRIDGRVGKIAANKLPELFRFIAPDLVEHGTHIFSVPVAKRIKLLQLLLIEADVFNPSPAGAEPPKVPSPAAFNLEANVRRWNIDVDRIVSIHERIVPYSELLAAIGKKPAAAMK